METKTKKGPQMLPLQCTGGAWDALLRGVCVMSRLTRHAKIESLHAQGFDRTTDPCRPRCSKCEVLVIQGVPCHETGCRHITHECHGCNARVARGIRYCAECA